MKLPMKIKLPKGKIKTDFGIVEDKDIKSLELILYTEDVGEDVRKNTKLKFKSMEELKKFVNEKTFNFRIYCYSIIVTNKENKRSYWLG